MTDSKKIATLALYAAPILGLCASLYALRHHLAVHLLGETGYGCNLNEFFNCDVVALSRFSEVAGIPLGVWGVSYFCTILAFLGLRQRQVTANVGKLGYLLMLGLGLLSTAGLASISLLELKKICLVCLTVYLSTWVQLPLAWVLRRELKPRFAAKAALLTVGATIIAVTTVVGLFSTFRHTLYTLILNKSEQEMQAILSADTLLARAVRSELMADLPARSKVVTLDEFLDFECPNCAVFRLVVNTLRRDFGPRIKIRFHHFPMDKKCNRSWDMHENSCEAAYYGYCMDKAGRFWDFYQIAFERQYDLSPEALVAWTKGLNVDTNVMAGCVKSPEAKSAIAADIQLATKLGVEATPGVFIDGRAYIGPREYAGYKRAVAIELERR